MRFVNKDGLAMEVDPVCASLFVKRGWTPVVEVTENIEIELHTMNSTLHNVVIGENWDEDYSGNDNTHYDNASEKKEYTNRAITRMTKEDILSLAKECGYTITSTNKTDIVNDFLLRQSEQQ